MEKGGNMKSVFDRFCDGLKKVESIVQNQGYEFMWNQHLGYVLTCPSNLGTGLRCGVHIKIPKLAEHPDLDSMLLVGNDRSLFTLQTIGCVGGTNGNRF